MGSVPISSFFAGAATVLAFAPFGLQPVALLTFAWLIHLWMHAPPRGCAWFGFWFGLGLYGAGVSQAHRPQTGDGARRQRVAITVGADRGRIRRPKQGRHERHERQQRQAMAETHEKASWYRLFRGTPLGTSGAAPASMLPLLQ